MANWSTAYSWMMDNEDAARVCAEVPDAAPSEVVGPCYSISGINSGAWPAEFEAIAALPQNQREPLVQQFYQNHFWNMWYAQLDSDEVAKRVFDFAVNGGSGPAVRCLQQAVNVMAGPDGAQLVDDGEWGPHVLGAANGADAAALVPAFQTRRVAHYDAIVAANPSLSRYLTVWTARAQK